MVSHVGYDQPSLYPIVRSVPVASSRITVLWSSWNALQQDVGVTDGHGSLAGSRRVVSPLIVSCVVSSCIEYGGEVQGVCPIGVPSSVQSDSVWFTS